MNKQPSPWRRRFRATHRWVAVAAGAYFVLMAATGVLLNHSDLLAGVDLPRSWLPGEYEYRHGNRNGLRGAVEGKGGKRYLYGEAGVWEENGEGSPVALDDGYPRGAYRRDTRALVRVEGNPDYLLAGTRGGLFVRSLGNDVPSRWQPVPLGTGDGASAPVVDLMRAGDRVLALTRDHLFSASPVWPPAFRDVTPVREEEGPGSLPLFRLLFHAHSGESWGLPGRLAVDGVGVFLLLFCGSGLWFGWRRMRRTLPQGRGGRLARKGMRWHLSLGRWLAIPLLLVALTGLFQRPPFLIAVAALEYPPWLHPAPRPDNPWHDLLRKVAYDPVTDQLFLATSDGFFRGPADNGAPFRPTRSSPPVSVMGATVFQRAPGGLFWVGSMSGLYVWDPASGWVTDAFTGRSPMRSFGPPVGDHAVAGLLSSDPGAPLVVDYFQGVIDALDRRAEVPLPAELQGGGRISLWHALFEVHNGRIFGFALGWWSWIVVPLGGLALTAEVVSGWAGSRRRRSAVGR